MSQPSKRPPPPIQNDAQDDETISDDDYAVRTSETRLRRMPRRYKIMFAMIVATVLTASWLKPLYNAAELIARSPLEAAAFTFVFAALCAALVYGIVFRFFHRF